MLHSQIDTAYWIEESGFFHSKNHKREFHLEKRLRRRKKKNCFQKDR